MEIIAIGLSPDIESDDVKRALSIFLQPWRWFETHEINNVRNWFKKNYYCEPTFFSSGRSALTALLTSLGIGKGDEVVLQAFTCMVVPNAVRFTGAVPVYADIDTSANIDPKDFERKITKRTKAVIVQHTFGTPADMDVIMKIVQKYNILVVEDCAHACGAVYKGKKVGTIGDGAIFSFGRDKIISSVFGGCAITKYKKIAQKLRVIESDSPNPSFFWVFQQLFHSIAMSVVLPLYPSGIGKILLVFLQKLHVLSVPVSKPELAGDEPTHYMMRYPNALASLLINQLSKLDRYTKTRQQIGMYYERELDKRHIQLLQNREQSARLRFGIITHKQKQILRKAKQNNVLLGNWYHNIVDPIGSDMSKSGYVKGSCPHAEQLAKRIVNLPTRITQTQADKIIHIISSV